LLRIRGNKADLAALQARVIKWLVPLILGQTGLIG